MARRSIAATPEPAAEDELSPPIGLGRSADSFDRLRRGASAAQGIGESEAEDEHAWLTTYTDMVTLLLTCFIMLISVATFTGSKSAPSVVPPNPGRAAPGTAEAGAAVAGPTLPASRGVESAEPDRVPDALFLRQPPETWSARLSRDLQRFVDGAALPGGITVETTETVVTVRLNDTLLFPSGRVEVEPAGQALLRELAPLLETSPARIEVRGHTDSVPIGSWLFPSNWELSAARAAAVVRALIAAGMPPERLFAAGYADTRPLAGNRTEEGRRANRRVELVLRTPFDPPGATAIPGPAASR